MNIRKAEEKDIPRLLALLGQVLQIHAEIRPDIFIPGTTKYTVCELAALLKQEDKPIYVAVNEEDVCMGYAFCQLKEQPFSTNMVPFKSLFIDDLCVDKQTRGQHIGESLFDYGKAAGKSTGLLRGDPERLGGKHFGRALLRKNGHEDQGAADGVYSVIRASAPYFGCPSGKIGLLSSMFTAPSYRRNGIARELLSRVIAVP